MGSIHTHPYTRIFEGMPKVFDSKSFERLQSNVKHLHLYNTAVSAENLNSLPKFEQLESLMINSDAQLADLRFLSKLTNLKTLCLYSSFRDENLEILINLPLMHLDLSVGTWPNLLQRLVGLPKNLRSLNVSAGPQSASEACQLLESHPHLECVTLNRVDSLTDDLVMALDALPLKNLDLQSSRREFDDDEVDRFLKLKNRNLVSLSLNSVDKLTAGFAEFLSEFPDLAYVELGTRTAGHDWWTPILKMQQLKEFSINSTEIKRSILIPKQLKEGLANCQLFDMNGMYLPK